MSAPKRIQRQRTKGWRMPAGAVYVGRPSEWGNPWHAGDHLTVDWPLNPDGSTKGLTHVRQMEITPALAVELYRQAFTPDQPEAIAELRGRDLACWCPLDRPCHADVLLELANARTTWAPGHGGKPNAGDYVRKRHECWGPRGAVFTHDRPVLVTSVTDHMVGTRIRGVRCDGTGIEWIHQPEVPP